MVLLIIIIIIIIIIIYNSVLCSTKQKEKGKRLHYLQCGSSLLNHGDMSMLNRAYMNNKFQDRKQHNETVW